MVFLIIYYMAKKRRQKQKRRQISVFLKNRNKRSKHEGVTIALAFLLAGISAVPSDKGLGLEPVIRSGNERLVTGNIVSAIEDFAQSIRDAGLDPLYIVRESRDYALPVPSIFNLKSSLLNFHFRGLSNIVINRMNYALVTSRLTFNIELPEIDTWIGMAEWDVKLFDRRIHGSISGGLTVKNIVISGDVRVNVGIISGISIRSMDIQLSLGGIASHLNVVLQGNNVSRNINNYLGNTIPGTLKAYERDINQLITIIAREVVEQNL
ncbi:uncharacterized protein LOC125226712 [Leguminivora glycinivorella]|uniref:uncharacterized protein LOC125226712 n=1 Tax=Leguminivora glycinivorella TaxID=1035111 RepID=UPI00200F085B|nr:uncharacterized protein LOC125226712 [Leguminivora glycinivorella]